MHAHEKERLGAKGGKREAACTTSPIVILLSGNLGLLKCRRKMLMPRSGNDYRCLFLFVSPALRIRHRPWLRGSAQFYWADETRCPQRQIPFLTPREDKVGLIYFKIPNVSHGRHMTCLPEIIVRGHISISTNRRMLLPQDINVAELTR